VGKTIARIPSVADGLLDLGVPSGAAALAVGSPAWFAWLADDAARSFSFRSAHGSYTARKEHRQRRGAYWVAYRTAGGRQRKAYLGKAEELTPERLTEAAAALAGLPAASPPTALSSAATPQLPLLATKLFAPRPRPDLVARPRLLERLDAGLASARCTLLSAPAGAGKTTLLAAWLARLDRRVAWLALDERDQDVHQIVQYLIAALQGIAPACGRAALALYDAVLPPPLEVVLTSLLNDLAALPEPRLLVLDDYHLVRAPAVHQALVFLLDHLPPAVHLVIATREDPPLPLPRLRARSQLTEVRAADLRFTQEEADSLLTASLGLRLADEQVAALVERTEGWAAGLQLAGLALRDRPDPAAFVAAFAGAHRLVADFLTAEVLERQTASVRWFLLATSILGRLSAPLCDALLGVDEPGKPRVADSQRLLEEAERANLFLVPLDDERRWYRYHHLFADALRARLAQETGPGTAAALHRRASAWFETQGLHPEAVHHALAAGDGALAARLIQGLSRVMQLRGEMTTLMDWLTKLPEDVLRARPRLGVIYAWGLVTNGQLVAAERWVQEVESALTAPEERADLLGEVAVIRARAALIHGQYQRAVELAHEALARLREDQVALRALTYVSLGSACMGLGDLDTSCRSLTRASALYQSAGHRVQALLPLRQLVRAQRAQGRLSRVEQTAQEALDIAAEWGQRSPLVGYTYLTLAELAYERNDLALAERYFNDGLALVELGGTSDVLNVLNLVDAHLGLAWLKATLGDRQGGLELIRRIEPVWERLARAIQERGAAERSGQGEPAASPPGLVALNADRIAACQARLWLSQGDIAAASGWAHRSQRRLEEPIVWERGQGPLVLARVLIAQGEHERALALLKQQLGLADATGQLGRLIEVLALQALALHAQGEESAALVALERALLLAQSEGYIRTFVDEGLPMAALLQEALTRGSMPTYIAQLLTAFRTQEEAKAGDQELRGESKSTSAPLPRPASTLLAEPVTARELEVLRLLAAGASNAEVARELVVEQSTVKTHLIHLYGKLGVHSRTQAVARARALLLLD
jgi:LuxR family maltose regulon positive regulatory protein